MTTESWGVGLLVLAPVLLGAAIPALVQLRATLRAVERTLLRSGARLDEALSATVAAAGRIDAMVARLEKGGRIEELVDGLAAASRMVSQLRDTVRVAAAVGAAVAPAVAAAVRALRQEPEAAAPTPLRTAETDAAPAVPPEPTRQASP